MFAIIRCALLLCWLVGTAALAADRVLGLLTLPGVYGESPCQRITPGEVALYAAPQASARIGRIEVLQGWTMQSEGGCSGRRVAVRFDSQPDAVLDLPSRELDYEKPAALVLEAHAPWFRLQMPNGSAWVLAGPQDRYQSLADLLRDGLSYVAVPDAIGWDQPQGRVLDRRWARGTPVTLRETRFVGEQLWLHVDLLSHSVCESPEPAHVLVSVWMPAHTESGEPVIWFHSRGC